MHLREREKPLERRRRESVGEEEREGRRTGGENVERGRSYC